MNDSVESASGSRSICWDTVQLSSIQLALAVIGQRSFASGVGLGFFLRRPGKTGAVHRERARLDHVAVRDDVDASGPSRSQRPLERRRDIRRALDQFALGPRPSAARS